jgi:hypothetical protein
MLARPAGSHGRAHSQTPAPPESGGAGVCLSVLQSAGCPRPSGRRRDTRVCTFRDNDETRPYDI